MGLERQRVVVSSPSHKAHYFAGYFADGSKTNKRTHLNDHMWPMVGCRMTTEEIERNRPTTQSTHDKKQSSRSHKNQQQKHFLCDEIKPMKAVLASARIFGYTTLTTRTATGKKTTAREMMKRSFSTSASTAESAVSDVGDPAITSNVSNSSAVGMADVSLPSSPAPPNVRFTVHSIFRNMNNHKAKILPHGLEWDLGGDSLVAYVPLLPFENDTGSSVDIAKSSTATSNSSSADMLIQYYKKYQSELLVDTPTIRRAIVEAHNRFCFAKDLSFKSVDDIKSLTLPTIVVASDYSDGKDGQDDHDALPANSTTTANNINRLHYYVEWKDVDPSIQYTETPSLSMQSHYDTIENDPSATGEIPPSEVWLNGYYIGLLSPTTVDGIMSKIIACPSLRLTVKKSYTTTLTTPSSQIFDNDSDSVVRTENSESVHGQLEEEIIEDQVQQEEKKEEAAGIVGTDNLSTSTEKTKENQRQRTRIIRVERKFRGGIRGYDVFDHMLDNLYALEDVEVLKDDDNVTTYIGTATVADWVMGGDLTSRLWVQKDKVKGDIQFYRPLYNDDISTTDRRYRLIKSHKQNDDEDMEKADQSDDSDIYDELYRKTFPKEDDGNDDAKIDIVDAELDRIRYLAGLPLPYPEFGQGEPAPEKTPRELQHRRNRRRYFGM